MNIKAVVTLTTPKVAGWQYGQAFKLISYCVPTCSLVRICAHEGNAYAGTFGDDPLIV